MNTDKSSFTIHSIVISFIIFIIGAFIGAILEKLYDNWILDKISSPDLHNVTTANLSILAIILFFLVLIFSCLLLSINLMRQLYNKIGIEIRYVDVKESGEVYRSFSEVVKKATETIYVVNSHFVEGDLAGRETSQAKNARDEYYNLLLEKAQNEVQYERIIQVSPDDNNTLKGIKANQALFSHLKQMIALRGSFSNILLYKSPPRRVTTFVLIDKKHLIWQIDEVDFSGDKNGKLGLHGAFIIHDPMSRITEHFHEYFIKLRSENDGLIKCRADELI